MCKSFIKLTPAYISAFIERVSLIWKITLSHLINAMTELAPVVQTLDSAIHRINHYPADKYYGNQLCYLLDSDLSGG